MERLTRPLFRLDPGWLFIAAGLVICAAGVILPAQADLQALQRQLDQLREQETQAYARLRAHSDFMDQVDRADPALIRRLAATQLNMVPEGDEPVLLAANLSLPVTHWIDSTLQSDIRPPKIAPTSILSRLASGPHRLWLFGGGIMAVFIGLMLGSGARSGLAQTNAETCEAQADVNACLTLEQPQDGEEVEADCDIVGTDSNANDRIAGEDDRAEESDDDLQDHTSEELQIAAASNDDDDEDDDDDEADAVQADVEAITSQSIAVDINGSSSDPASHNDSDDASTDACDDDCAVKMKENGTTASRVMQSVLVVTDSDEEDDTDETEADVDGNDDDLEDVECESMDSSDQEDEESDEPDIHVEPISDLPYRMKNRLRKDDDEDDKA